MSEQMMQKAEATMRDALDHARAAAQEFHQAISGVVAKRPDAKKAEIEGVLQKAKMAAESIRSAMRAQHGAAQEQIKQHLTKAADRLDASEKHAAESLKSSGEAFHAAFGKALADARASLQNISEAVAARRSANAAKHPLKRAS